MYVCMYVQEDVRKVFAPFGQIREIIMSHDPQTGRSKVCPSCVR